MALDATTTFEIRATGNSANGGGFVPGSSGADYSQQDAPAVNDTDLEIDGTDATKVQASSSGSDWVGNIINILDGSGFTPGRYHCISADGHWITLDREAGTVGSTGGTFRVGGAVDHPATIMPTSASFTAWIKAGTYSGAGVGGGMAWSFLKSLGYNSTRGDKPRGNNRPLFGFSIVMYDSAIIENARIVPYNYVSDGHGVQPGWGSKLRNCYIEGYGTGFAVSNIGYNGYLYDCDLRSDNIAVHCQSKYLILHRCTIRPVGSGIGGNHGVYVASYTQVCNCLIYNFPIGLFIPAADRVQCTGNTIIGTDQQVSWSTAIQNSNWGANLFADNLCYRHHTGIIGVSTSDDYWAMYERNRFYDVGTPYYNAAPGRDDVIASGSPFVDFANGDYHVKPELWGENVPLADDTLYSHHLPGALQSQARPFRTRRR